MKNAHMYPSTKQGFKFQCTLQMYTHAEGITVFCTNKNKQARPPGSVLFQIAAANVFL